MKEKQLSRFILFLGILTLLVGLILTGYINISIFANNTAKQFKEALSKLEDEKIEGLIVDVRDNPGGYLETAIEISDLLLNKDKVIYKTNDGDKIEATYSKGKKDYDKRESIKERDIKRQLSKASKNVY